MDIDLTKLLPKSIRNPFWSDIADVMSQEYTYIRENIDTFKLVYDLDYQISIAEGTGDYSGLLMLATMLGFTIDTSLEPTPEEIGRLIDAIPYLVKNKTKLIIYNLFFKEANQEGAVFICYWNGSKLIRAVSDYVTDLDAKRIAHTLGIYNLSPNLDYKLFLLGDNYLDATTPLVLDDANVWYLDQDFQKVTTKHLAFEFNIGTYRGLTSNLIVENSREFIMTKKYMDYLRNSMDYNRKLIEFPHIGIQFSLIADESGYCDSLDPGSIYTFPTLKTNCAVNYHYAEGFNIFNGMYIVLGTGTHIIPTVASGTPLHIESLQNEVARVAINIEEINDFADMKWLSIGTLVNANKVTEIISGQTDGVKTEFTGTLSYPEIYHNTLRFKFINNLKEKIVTDQYQSAIGFYEEVALQIEQQSDLYAMDSISSVTYTLSKSNVQSNSTILAFYYNDELIQVQESNGIFENQYITSGSIDVTTGSISIIFSITTDALKEVRFNYSYEITNSVILTKSAYAEVDYLTGEYILYTKYPIDTTEVISTTSLTNISYTIANINNGQLIPDGIKLSYYTTDGTQWIVEGSIDTQNPNNDGYRLFIGTNIDSGQIDLTTGLVTVTFNNPTSFVNNIEISYTYNTLVPPDISSNIVIEYFTKQNLEITECGIMDSTGNLIAYATFPPILLGDINYHSAFQWLIYKDLF